MSSSTSTNPEQILPRLVPGWPKLAWVASIQKDRSDIRVLHGPMVELAKNWAAEAVWAGDFGSGDFDRTDLVFGSGIRVRESRVTFVSSGTTIDRLWHTWDGEQGYVSNSLPAILAVAGLSLRSDYSGYVREIATITKGLGGYVTSIPTMDSEIHVTYFNNLVFDGSRITEVAKPDSAPSFACYDDYRGFLIETARLLQGNASSPTRAFPVKALASISSGYDSAAAAVVAKDAGCDQAVTFGRATSLWRGPDSGRSIAEQMGIFCDEHRDWRNRDCSDEATVWAATGRCCDLNLATLDYPEPVCMFFTGFRGGGVWDYGKKIGPRALSRTDTSGLGLCELRLVKGFFNIPVPFWAARHEDELHALSRSEEMAPWRIGGNYDRPLARRLLEEAGVQRGTFAIRKKNTQSEEVYTWPHSHRARDEFTAWLDEQGVRHPPALLLPVLKAITAADNMVAKNLLCKVGWRHKGIRKILLSRANGMLFQWANSELSNQCREAYMAVSNGSYQCADNLANIVAEARTHG